LCLCQKENNSRLYSVYFFLFTHVFAHQSHHYRRYPKVSDIMDYDEFITGMRNEAFFTVSKSFLPRLAAAPAAALPVRVYKPPSA